MARICKTGFKEPTTKCSIQENCIKIADETFTLCSAWIHSVCANPVWEVSGIFKREQPLIHLLSDEIQVLLRQLMRFLKQECIKEKLWLTNTESSNQLSDQEMIIGEKTAAAFKKLSRDKRRAELLGMFFQCIYMR